MRQRIHPGADGHRCRHRDGQLGVGDDHHGQHLRVEDDLLGVDRLVGHDRGPADLGAGARSRRHGDDRRDGAGVGPGPPVADVLEVPERPGLAVLEGDQLACVERRAAAERDDAVVPAVAERRDSGLDVGRDRVRRNAGEYRRRDAGRLQHAEGLPGDRQAGHHRIGDEQRTGDPGHGARFGQLVDPSGTEADLRRVAPVGLHRLIGGWRPSAGREGAERPAPGGRRSQERSKPRRSSQSVTRRSYSNCSQSAVWA